jgi:hypothetical protein
MKIKGIIVALVTGLCIFAGVASPANADIPTGTVVPVQLQDNLFSGRQHEGDVVHFKTSADVLVAGQVVIPAGSMVVGTVTHSHRSGCCGQPGRISFAPDHVVLSDGTQIPLRHDESSFRGGDDRVGSVGLGIVFSPIWLLINGGNGKAHVGTAFSFVTAGP